ncbi:MAG: dTDP-4-dehydrorhamnose 3,5-epimerase [Gammaproteobacteria bacterium]|tara:strand:+ start:467 stop:1003 length:537 start_codon:yes stop_codon:yes gene_type:complete
MKVTSTKLDGCLILEPDVYDDPRGFFMESFNAKTFRDVTGINVNFVQDNHSQSSKGVLRGLHYQKLNPQAKLVRVSRGSVFDVAVDIRTDSSTYGHWIGVELSESNNLQLWIPEGFAHGFLVTSEIADFQYKCTNYYLPEDEGSIHWKDPDLNIKWPSNLEIFVSKKDSKADSFKAIN